MFIPEPDTAFFIRQMDGAPGTVLDACIAYLAAGTELHPLSQADISRRTDTGA